MKIYFDMDGVLADFDKGVMDFINMNSKNRDKSKEEDNLMWSRLSKIDNFYDKLEPIEGAITMFDTIYNQYGKDCEILTGIPKPERGLTTSAEDKRKWVRRLLSEEVVVNTVYRREKKNFAKGNVLIDDLQTNIDEWNEAGGIGILFKSVPETLEELEKRGLINKDKSK